MIFMDEPPSRIAGTIESPMVHLALGAPSSIELTLKEETDF